MVIEWGEFGDKSLDFILKPIEQDARINILTGSVRSSKTVTMIPKWLNYIQHGPPGLLLMAGVSKSTIYDNVLGDLFDLLGKRNYDYDKQSGDLRIYNRKLKVLGAKDDGAEKYLRGKTLSGAYVDEAVLIPKNFFLQLLNRLSAKGSKLYATTNPDSPSHYLYTDYISDKDKLASGMVRIIQYQLSDNPNLSQEYLDFITNAYPGVFYRRSILGEWVMAEGAIFDCLDDDLNFYDKIPLSLSELERCDYRVAVDVGTQNAQVYLKIVDDGDIIYIDDEYFYSGRAAQKSGTGTQKTHAEYGDEFDKFVQLFARELSVVTVDPASASFKEELRRRGYRVRDAVNDVIEGIKWTCSLLQRRKVKINRRCVNLIRQMNGYVWDTKKTEDGKEQPLKQEDDAPDALRYDLHTNVKKYRLD